MPGHISQRADLYLISDTTCKLQAIRVFQLLMQEIEAQPEKKIALLYAANNGQALSFYDAYRQTPETLYIPGGSGQAVFFQEFNQLVNSAVQDSDSKLTAGQIRVLPIATSLYGGANTPGNQVSKKHLDRDLAFVDAHLQSGYTIYGFQAYSQHSKQHRYAIGGGESRGFYMTGNDYPSIDGKSQGAYVQHILGMFENTYNHDTRREDAPNTLVDDLLKQDDYQKPAAKPVKKSGDGTPRPPQPLQPVATPSPSTPAATTSSDKADPAPESDDKTGMHMQQAAILTAALLMIAGGIYTSSTLFIALGLATLIYDAYLFVNEERSSLFTVRL